MKTHVELEVGWLNSYAYYEVKIYRAWRWDNSENNEQFILVGLKKSSRKKKQAEVNKGFVCQASKFVIYVVGDGEWLNVWGQYSDLNHQSSVETFTGVNYAKSSHGVDLSLEALCLNKLSEKLV